MAARVHCAGSCGRWWYSPPGPKARACPACAPPWTPDADALLRSSYAAEGINGARVAFPGRSVSALYHRARRLGVPRRRRWTSRDLENLRELWAEGRSLETIAAHLGRGVPVTYWKAQQIGLNHDIPPGFERLSDAAARTGYTTGQLARIFGWAHKRIRLVLARPGPRRTGKRYRMVDTIALEDALGAWHETETAQAAARRLGISGDRLRVRLSKLGKPTGRRKHRRFTEADIAAANALARPRRIRMLGRAA